MQKCIPAKSMGARSLEATDLTHQGSTVDEGKGPSYLVVHDSVNLRRILTYFPEIPPLPIRAECISCPRKTLCAHLWCATDVWTQKPQDAINGPLRVVPSISRVLQIITITFICFVRESSQISFISNFTCISLRTSEQVFSYVREKRYRNSHPPGMRQGCHPNSVLLIKIPGLSALITKCKCTRWISRGIRWWCVSRAV